MDNHEHLPGQPRRRWLLEASGEPLQLPTGDRLYIGDGEHVAYRMLDSVRRVIYIGATNSPTGRFREHRQTSPWFPRVDAFEIRVFCCMQEARAYEAEDIHIHSGPELENIIHNIGFALHGIYGRTDGRPDYECHICRDQVKYKRRGR